MKRLTYKVFGLLIFNSCVGSEDHPTINGDRLPTEPDQPLNNSTLFSGALYHY
ncbi:MAG: hypothetical protein MUP09_02070 [Thiovulaceae bacterium]|nr:hypothetical protein [Sulfurimonadaceae bacterium]